MEILIIALVIGLLPAFIARSKGQNFILWYVYGVALFIVALPHSLLMGRKPTEQERLARSQPDRVQSPAAPASDGGLVAQGAGGRMTFNGREVVIDRSGALSFLIHGLAGEKSIHISAIQAVQLRKARGGVRGYIQLTVLGGIENRGGAVGAAGDENSVLFDVQDQPAFERMADALKEAMHETRKPQVAAVSAADELAKFASLRDQGVLTDEEFENKKRAILAG